MGRGESEKKISWIKWSTVFQPKGYGGLGVKDLEYFNLALLEKWVWRVMKEGNHLWAKVVVSRWGKSWREGLFGGEVGRSRNPSGWWGGVIKAIGEKKKGWFVEGLERVVENGEKTLFWWHEWAGRGRLKDRFNRLFQLALEKDARVRSMGEWREGE